MDATKMMRTPAYRSAAVLAALAILPLLAVLARPTGAKAQGDADEFNDSHFHLTNYIQEGQTAAGMLPIMGDTLKRAVQSAGLKPDQISKVLVDSTNPRVNREFLGFGQRDTLASSS